MRQITDTEWSQLGGSGELGMPEAGRGREGWQKNHFLVPEILGRRESKILKGPEA